MGRVGEQLEVVWVSREERKSKLGVGRAMRTTRPERAQELWECRSVKKQTFHDKDAGLGR